MITVAASGSRLMVSLIKQSAVASWHGRKAARGTIAPTPKFWAVGKNLRVGKFSSRNAKLGAAENAHFREIQLHN